jgi:hypothetical protein
VNREEQLAYMLKETEIAVRIMCRDRVMAHAFNLGIIDGQEYSVLIAILPSAQIANITAVPSEPL